MIRKLLALFPDERVVLQFMLLVDCGHCPGGCRDGFGGPTTSRVYRSSWRSITMQCTTCKLQWTMTVHRIADVAARKAGAANASPEHKLIAQFWNEWAAQVKERRGRLPSRDRRPVEVTSRAAT